MSEISRKSMFDLNEQESEKLKKDFENWINKFNVDNSPENLAEWAINNLYYAIGMLDYDIYRTAISKGFQDFARDVDSPKQALANMTPNQIEQMKSYLATRAHYSAMLQAFEEDIARRGYTSLVSLSEDGKPMEKLGDIRKENLENPEILYHGTSANITNEDIGKKDENGVYYQKDGVSYFIKDQSKAERFAGNNNGRILKRVITPEDQCAKMKITNCATCFMYQEQLRKLNRDGVKYILADSKRRPEILNIENFDDFVEQRDGAISFFLNTLGTRLPKENEGYSEYFQNLGLSKENIRAQQNGWSTRPKSHDARYMKYEELFPNLEQLQEISDVLLETDITKRELTAASKVMAELETQLKENHKHQNLEKEI